jgi:hypothetical protein
MDGPVLAIGRSAGAPVTPLSQGALQQMIEQTDEKAEAAHRRLREDLDKIDSRTSAIAAAQAQMQAALIKASTPDVSNLRMSPATVFGIISFLLMLGGGYLTIRDSIANLSRAQETQIADLRRAQEMQRVQLESLIKTVISQGKTP